MNVRGFNREDAKKVVELHSKFNEWFEELEINEDFIVQASLRPDFRFFVAEYKGVVIGFAGVLFYEHVGRAELGPICVEEDFQNQGVGSLLVDGALKFLTKKNIHRVVVKVKSGNENARKFFKSRGFIEEAVLKKYTKSGEEVAQMVLFLHNP